MTRKGAFLVTAIIGLGLLFCQAGFGQGLVIGKMGLDKNMWGLRYIKIPFDNQREDSVRITAEFRGGYANHYLSGMEVVAADSAFFAPPLSSGEYKLYFLFPGSFGQAKSHLYIRWSYLHPRADDPPYDSVHQEFSNTFMAFGESEIYSGFKHSVGPTNALMADEQLCFEYPRLVLYLLARGDSVTGVSRIFHTEDLYTYWVVDHFRQQELFSSDPFDFSPRLTAISEAEAFAVWPIFSEASAHFRKWYDQTGSEKLRKAITREKVREQLYDITALRMVLLLTLMEEQLIGQPIPSAASFVDAADDFRILNRPRWIVQGGDYFMPRRTLAAFERQGFLLIGSIVPQPMLGMDKMAMLNLQDSADQALRAAEPGVYALTAGQLRAILETARRDHLGKGIFKELDPFLEQIQAKLPYFKPEQRPYLIDYLIQVIIGDCFRDRVGKTELDCFGIEYQP